MGDGPVIRFRVLGPLGAELDDEGLTLGGPQQRLTLALLLAEFGKPVSVERLIDSIWGESPPRTAKKTLQVYVSHLRGILGDHCIESEAAGYRMVNASVDAVEFEELVKKARTATQQDPETGADALAEALGLWMGAPYAGFEDNQTLMAEATRLEQLRVAALEDRIEADLALGASSSVIGELESLVREFPYRERFRSQLMLALYRAGRQAEALRLFAQTRDLLIEELGIEPGPELWELERRILDQDPTLTTERAERPPVRAIAGYELRRVLAGGSFGRTYQAFDRGSERRVAVKVLAPEIAGESRFVSRFEPAMQLFSKLDHPHILPIDDYWRDADGAYLVFPWMEGSSLAAVLGDSRPWGSDQSLRLIDEVGAALSHAHRHGVVHGGVKPSDILFDAEGAAHLSDFPVIVARDGDYVAPEVADGDPPTARSDIYSFGLIVHQLFTGVLPDGSTSVSQLLSPAIQDVLIKAISPDPSHRFERVDDMRRAMRSATGADVVGVAEETAGAVSAPRNPYKGLRAFQESDARDFFGRDELVELTLEKIAHHRLVALVGPSGSGKSSLVKAGVIPSLREKRFLIADMYPGNYPFEELETALRRVAVDWPKHGVITDLTSDARGLMRVTKQILPEDDLELVLVIDQFEELFSLLEDDHTRSLFLESLATTVNDAHSRIRFVLTLRADFFDRPLVHSEFGKLLEAGVVPVTTPTQQELARAVAQPARHAGIEIEPGLISEIVSDFADQPGGLPLLQFTLTEMVEQTSERVLTAEHYARQGGIGGAVGARAEQVYLDQSPQGQRAIEQTFLRLVRVGEQGVFTRQRVRRTELAALEVDQKALASALQTYATRRLLTLDRDPITRGATVEVAHESLLESWPRLRSWIDNRRQDLILHRRYNEARQEWLANRSDDAFLLTGGRLAQLSSWAESTDLQLTAEELEFLDRSETVERAQERRGRRRRLTISSVLAVLVTVGVGLGLFAIQENRDSARQEISRIARSAIASVEEDPERSLLVGIAAAERSLELDGVISDVVAEALHESLIRMRVTATIELPDPINDFGGAIALSPDGALLAIDRGDGTVRLHDSETGEDGPILTPAEVPFEALAFGPDGQRMYGIDPGGIVWGWDLSGENARGATTSPGRGSGYWLDISPDGDLLVVGSDVQSSVWILDAENMNVLHEIDASAPTDAQFSPDGSTLAASHLGGLISLSQAPGWESGQERSEFEPADTPARINDIDWSPSGESIAMALDEGGTVVWDLNAGRVMQRFPGQFHEAIDFDTSGERLVIGRNDGSVQVVDIEQGVVLAELNGHDGPIVHALFKDTDTVITSSNDGTVRIWSISAIDQHEALTLRAHAGTGTGAGILTFSPDGSRLVTTSDSGEAKMWDTETWQLMYTIPDVARMNGLIPFSPDGDRFAVALGQSPPGRLAFWDPGLASSPTRTGIFDTETGELIIELAGHDGHELGRAFSPDGSLLVTTGADGSIKLWDLDTGSLMDAREIRASNLESLRPLTVSFSPSGDRVVSGHEDGSFKIWGVSSGELEELANVYMTNGWLIGPLYSPDGKRMAATFEDGPGAIWDAPGDDLVPTLPGAPYEVDGVVELIGHTGWPWGLAWSPDGSTFVTVSVDETLRVWDAASGDLRMTLTVPSPPTGGVDVSPDGLIAVGTWSEGLVYLYTLDHAELLRLARDRVTRNLSPSECTAFGIEPCPAPEPAEGPLEDGWITVP